MIDDVRDSEIGGMGHACELETSIYLALDPDAVSMDRAGGGEQLPRRQARLDGLVRRTAEDHALVERAVAYGVHGDATKATADKGRILLDAAVKECVEFKSASCSRRPCRSVGPP